MRSLVLIVFVGDPIYGVEPLPTQVHGYLYHKNWETRVAAGEAIGHLAEVFVHHSAQDLLAASGSTAGSTPSPVGSSALNAFNLQLILEKGTALVASGGQVGRAS